MYKITEICILDNTTFLVIEGKKCKMKIGITKHNTLDYQYCVYEKEGEDKEQNQIINQLITDCNLNDL